MKKLLFTLCCMIFAIASFAQSNVHIKFMGIPVTGTIAQFQAKLVAKGCTYNKVASASISNGTRAFKGTFVGNKVDIYVYYDTNTKIVYRTKAVVSGVKSILKSKICCLKNMVLTLKICTSEQRTERNLFHSFLQMMKEK